MIKKNGKPQIERNGHTAKGKMVNVLVGDKKISMTKMQKQAIDNIISGKFPSIKKSMVAAGYSEGVASNPKENLAVKPAVIDYVAALDKRAQQKWNMSIEDKVVNTYIEGMDATKLFGKDAISHPDYDVRKKYADRLAEFMGWIKPAIGMGGGPTQNNFNFFNVPKEEREAFNGKFRSFIDKVYK